MLQANGYRVVPQLNLAADQIIHAWRTAFVGDVHGLNARHIVEQLAGQVGQAAIAAGVKIDLARIGFGIGHQLR